MVTKQRRNRDKYPSDRKVYEYPPELFKAHEDARRRAVRRLIANHRELYLEIRKMERERLKDAYKDVL